MVEDDHGRLAAAGVEQRQHLRERVPPRSPGVHAGQPLGGGIQEGHPTLCVRGDDGVLDLVQGHAQPVALAGAGGF